MTNEEKFRAGKVLLTDGEDYILELWGASTKHPDTVFYFSSYEKVDWFPDEAQIINWLLYCSSRLTLPSHAIDLAEWALKYFDNPQKVLDNCVKM